VNRRANVFHLYILKSMAATGTVLCIHHDPGQLTLLREKGYGLVTATNGREGLRLLMSRPVDAVVLEYYLEILDGEMVADEIRRARPKVPIIMVADPVELPHKALKSVDTLVDKSAGAHFLWAAVHFLLASKASGSVRELKLERRSRLRS
jgi:DNA-binding response OmpR family regulator